MKFTLDLLTSASWFPKFFPPFSKRNYGLTNTDTPQAPSSSNHSHMIPGSDVVARTFGRCRTSEVHGHFLYVSLKKLGFHIKQLDTVSYSWQTGDALSIFSRLIFEVLFFAPVYFSTFVCKHFYINKAHICARVSAREHVRIRPTYVRYRYKKYFVATGPLVSLLFVLLLYGSLVGHQCDPVSILSLRCQYTNYTNLTCALLFSC